MAQTMSIERSEVRGGSEATARETTHDFGPFLDAHLDEAYRLATFILGRADVAEDVVHDAAIRAWRHWSDRRDPSRTEAWFRAIVVNACRDHGRRQRRVRAIDAGLDLAAAPHPVGDDPASAVTDAEAFSAVLRSIDLDLRVILALRYGLDLDVPTIATTLRIPEGTVKSRLHRAVAAARDVIGSTPPTSGAREER